jgi:hypothetical protein
MKSVVVKAEDRTYIELQSFTPYDIGECDLTVMGKRSMTDETSELTGSYSNYESYCDDLVSEDDEE